MKIFKKKKYLYLIGTLIVIVAIVLVFLFFNKKKVIEVVKTDEEVSLYFEYENLSLSVGDVFELGVNFSDESKLEDVIYTSSNEQVVSVVGDEVKALKNGTATLTAITPTGVKTSVEVVVASEEILVNTIDVIPTGVVIDEDNIELESGETYTVECSVFPTNASTTDIIWETTDARVAAVSDDGIITASSPGEAEIYVFYKTTMLGSIEVTVKSRKVTLSKLYILPTEMTLATGENYQLVIKYEPNNISDKTTTYKSSNNSVVTVSSSGYIKAIKEGFSIITATSNGVSSTSLITVDDSSKIVEVSSITLTPSISLNEKETKSISASVLPSNATNKNLIWSSNNTAIATVNGSGVVTGVKAGVTSIVARSTNGKLSTTNVTVLEGETSSTTSIMFSSSTVVLEPGSSKKVSVVVLPTTASQTLTWYSGNDSVVTVNNGTLKAVKAGNTNVVAMASNGVSATLKVWVSYPDITPSTRSNVIPTGSIGNDVLEKINEHLFSYLDEAAINGFNGYTGNRARVMAAAYFLIYNPYYRIQYVYGGNSKIGSYQNYPGWNPNWSSTVGLECQNFVMWSLWNAGAYNIYPTASILQHSTHIVDESFTVSSLIYNYGVEPGDIIRRSQRTNQNGHWAIVMEVNKDEGYIVVAHASDPNSDMLLTKYTTSSNFDYHHLYKLPDFY